MQSRQDNQGDLYFFPKTFVKITKGSGENITWPKSKQLTNVAQKL